MGVLFASHSLDFPVDISASVHHCLAVALQERWIDIELDTNSVLSIVQRRGYGESSSTFCFGMGFLPLFSTFDSIADRNGSGCHCLACGTTGRMRLRINCSAHNEQLFTYSAIQAFEHISGNTEPFVAKGNGITGNELGKPDSGYSFSL